MMTIYFMKIHQFSQKKLSNSHFKNCHSKLVEADVMDLRSRDIWISGLYACFNLFHEDVHIKYIGCFQDQIL